MKGILTLLLLPFVVGSLQAQLWQESFPQARELARQGDRPLLLVFSGSDWCGPCIRLKNKILDAPEFVAYTRETFVLYNADFPKKKQNQLPEGRSTVNRSLAERYNPKGFFPLIVVLDKEGNVLGETGFYPRYGTAKYMDLLNGFLR